MIASVLATEIDTSVLRPAVVVGAVAAALAASFVVVLRRSRPGVVGLPIALGALLVARHELGPAWAPVPLFAAVVVMFVFGEISTRSDSPLLTYAPVLGGVILALTPAPAVPILARIAAGVGAVLMGAAFSDFDRRHASQGLGVLLLVITCWAPLFLTPGGGLGPALAGVSVWMLLFLVPKPFARVGAGGAYAVAVVFWWFVMMSAGWPQGGDNMVGAAVCCGFPLLEPATRWVTRRMSGLENRRRSTRDALWLVIATAVVAQAAMLTYGVAVTARREMLDLALLSALPVFVVAALVATEVAPSPRRQQRRSTSE